VKKSKISRSDGERKDREKVGERKEKTPENEENMTPEERRGRAVDRQWMRLSRIHTKEDAKRMK
jgi:hypothetical protein